MRASPAASPWSPAARAASAAASSSCWPSAARRSASPFTSSEAPARELEAADPRPRRPRLVRASAMSPTTMAVDGVLQPRGGRARPGRHPGQQRRHRPRRARDAARRAALGRGARRQSRRRVSLRPRRGARHAAAPVGPDHQRLVAERADAAAGPDGLCRVEGRARRVHARAVARPGGRRACSSTRCRPG